MARATNTCVLLTLLPGREGGARHVCPKIRNGETSPQQVLQLACDLITREFGKLLRYLGHTLSTSHESYKVVLLLFNWGCAFWLLVSFDKAILQPEDFIHPLTHSLRKPL